MEVKNCINSVYTNIRFLDKIHAYSIRENKRKKERKMNEKKQRNQEKGITLIALVITVIVLLILVGVAIVALSGENRNFNTSDKCKYKNSTCRDG